MAVFTLFGPAPDPKTFRNQKAFKNNGNANTRPSKQTGADGPFPGALVSDWPVADPSPQNNPDLLANGHQGRGDAIPVFTQNVGRLKYGGIGEFEVGARSIEGGSWIKTQPMVRPADDKQGITKATPQATHTTWQIPKALSPRRKANVPSGGDVPGVGPSPGVLGGPNRIIRVLPRNPAMKTVPVKQDKIGLRGVFSRLFRRNGVQE